MCPDVSASLLKNQIHFSACLYKMVLGILSSCPSEIFFRHVLFFHSIKTELERERKEVFQLEFLRNLSQCLSKTESIDLNIILINKKFQHKSSREKSLALNIKISHTYSYHFDNAQLGLKRGLSFTSTPPPPQFFHFIFLFFETINNNLTKYSILTFDTILLFLCCCRVFTVLDSTHFVSSLAFVQNLSSLHTAIIGKYFCKPKPKRKENTQKVKFRGHRHSIISIRDGPAKL